ncbi:MAG: hypothetical protein QW104_07205 [Nitrososphaerota archaeon]
MVTVTDSLLLVYPYTTIVTGDDVVFRVTTFVRLHAFRYVVATRRTIPVGTDRVFVSRAGVNYGVRVAVNREINGAKTRLVVLAVIAEVFRKGFDEVLHLCLYLVRERPVEVGQ